MGHYSDAYEREEDDLRAKREAERAAQVEKIRRDLEAFDVAEVIMREREGYYKR